MKRKTYTCVRNVAIFLLILAFVFACCASLFGCKKTSDGRKVNNIQLHNMDIYYYPTDEIDFEAMTLNVYYEDGTSEVLTKKEYDVKNAKKDDTQFIMNTDGLYEAAIGGGEIPEGNYDISCTVVSTGYKKDIATVTIGSNYLKDLSVLLYGDPEFVEIYKDNMSECIGDGENEFYRETGGYFVGDDNPFEYKPVVQFINNNTGAMGTFSSYDVEVSVTLLDESLDAGGNPENIESSEYLTYADFAFDFAEAAIGKTFRIEMYLDKYTNDCFGGKLGASTLDVTIADGFNATSAMDLGKMNLVSNSFNKSDYVNGDDEKSYRNGEPYALFWDHEAQDLVAKNTIEIWKDFLSENGYDLEPINGIFLHGDISVTSDDFPSDFVVGEEEASHFGYNYDEMVGSVRDGVKIYEKNIEEDFVFNGNSFTIDASQIRWTMMHIDFLEDTFMYYPENYAGSYRASSTALIAFQGLTDNTVGENDRAVGTIKNVNAIGNAFSEGDMEGKSGGSLIFFISRSSITKASNCIVKNFLYGMEAQNSSDMYTNLDVEYSKFYDCYHDSLYIDKSAVNHVKQSDFKRCGGAIIRAVSGLQQEGSGNHFYYYAGVDFDETVSCDNPIYGDEAWFVANNATAVVTYIQMADYVIETFSDKTILDSDNKMNLIYVGHGDDYFQGRNDMLNSYFCYNSDDVAFMLSEDVLDPNTETRDNYESLSEYNAALTNYFVLGQSNSENIDSGAISLLLLPIVFMTDSGKAFSMSASDLELFDSLSLAQNGYVSPEDVEPIQLDENDRYLYVYYDMAGSGLSLVVELYDKPSNG